MLGKRGSELRIGCEYSLKPCSTTSWVQNARTCVQNIPHVDWACPPRFLVDPDWKMEVGSESQETRIQLQRELGTIEAIYYFNYEIPPNPYVALDAHDFNDASQILVIPLDVVSDETSPDDSLISSTPTVKVEEKTTQPLLPRDEVMGTAVALVDLMKSKGLGSQVDLELLIQLLRNPGMLDQLMKEHGLSANQSSLITHAPLHECSSIPLPIPRPAAGGCRTGSPSAPFSHSLSRGVKNMIEQFHSNSESQNRSCNKKADLGKLRKLINEYGVHLGDRVKPGPTVVKDAEYYRRLISLHGSSQENDKPKVSLKLTGLREQRRCRYFNRPDGCRLGSSCQFQHVRGGLRAGSRAVEEEQGAKRMKRSGIRFARHSPVASFNM